MKCLKRGRERDYREMIYEPITHKTQSQFKLLLCGRAVKKKEDKMTVYFNFILK